MHVPCSWSGSRIKHVSPSPPLRLQWISYTLGEVIKTINVSGWHPAGVYTASPRSSQDQGGVKSEDDICEAVPLSTPRKDQQKEFHSMNLGSCIVVRSSLESVRHVFTPLLSKISLSSGCVA